MPKKSQFYIYDQHFRQLTFYCVKSGKNEIEKIAPVKITF